MKYSLILFFCLLFILGCTDNNRNSVAEETIMPEALLPSKKLNAGFLIVNGVYNSELVAPMDILQHTIFHTEYGIEVFTIGPSKNSIKTFEGLNIIPDYSWSDSLPTVDILIVPSAEHSMDSDLENDELINFVKRVGGSAQFIMSLCDGAFVLAKAGLLDGLECTTFPTDIPKFRETFPSLLVHEDVSFVHDGKAITSAGGAKSYDPALYLTELLYGNKAAIGVGKGLVIDWDVNRIPHVLK